MTSRSKGTSPFLSAALAYAERGWRVFPLVPREKRPITDSGFQDASSNRHQVLEWWQAFPYANIGLACGGPFDVLDIDGAESVPHLQELLGSDYRHAGPVANTGKGKHLYFAAVDTARNRAGLLRGRLDYRGLGGYVVAPPSVHPSGRIYHWDRGRDESLPLPTIPDNLREIILKPPAPQRTPLAVAQGSLTRHQGGLLMTNRGELLSQRPDILEVCAALGLSVSPHGAYFHTNCIFHNDPGPSMVLYTEQNKFHCYGCEAQGDSFDLRARRDRTGREAIF